MKNREPKRDKLNRVTAMDDFLPSALFYVSNFSKEIC
jgi:hypothetical protein